MTTRIIEYIPTEYDLQKVVGNILPATFLRDYAAIKTNTSSINNAIILIESQIEVLQGKVADLETEVKEIKFRLTRLEYDIQILTLQLNRLAFEVQQNAEAIKVVQSALKMLDSKVQLIDIRLSKVESDLLLHVSATNAHGSTGDIVGTGDYAQSALGGVVLLANAVTDASSLSITPTATVIAAPATYTQAYTQSQTDAINAISNNVNLIVNALNAVASTVNNSLSTERTAKQRAT